MAILQMISRHRLAACKLGMSEAQMQNHLVGETQRLG